MDYQTVRLNVECDEKIILKHSFTGLYPLQIVGHKAEKDGVLYKTQWSNQIFTLEEYENTRDALNDDLHKVDQLENPIQITAYWKDTEKPETNNPDDDRDMGPIFGGLLSEYKRLHSELNLLDTEEGVQHTCDDGCKVVRRPKPKGRTYATEPVNSPENLPHEQQAVSESDHENLEEHSYSQHPVAESAPENMEALSDEQQSTAKSDHENLEEHGYSPHPVAESAPENMEALSDEQQSTAKSDHENLEEHGYSQHPVAEPGPHDKEVLPVPQQLPVLPQLPVPTKRARQPVRNKSHKRGFSILKPAIDERGSTVREAISLTPKLNCKVKRNNCIVSKLCSKGTYPIIVGHKVVKDDVLYMTQWKSQVLTIAQFVQARDILKWNIARVEKLQKPNQVMVYWQDTEEREERYPKDVPITCRRFQRELKKYKRFHPVLNSDYIEEGTKHICDDGCMVRGREPVDRHSVIEPAEYPDDSFVVPNLEIIIKTRKPPESGPILFCAKWLHSEQLTWQNRAEVKGLILNRFLHNMALAVAWMNRNWEDNYGKVLEGVHELIDKEENADIRDEIKLRLLEMWKDGSPIGPQDQDSRLWLFYLERYLNAPPGDERIGKHYLKKEYLMLARTMMTLEDEFKG